MYHKWSKKETVVYWQQSHPTDVNAGPADVRMEATLPFAIYEAGNLW